MKILIVSDSHGHNEYLKKVINKTGKIDLFIHLGDLEGGEKEIASMVSCPVEMVSGNNDYFTNLEREKLIVIGSYKVMLTHGHRYHVNYGVDFIKEVAGEKGANIVMFGHTHRPLLDLSGTVMAVNPGSIAQPRQEGRIPTFILMEIDEKGDAHFHLNYVKQ